MLKTTSQRGLQSCVESSACGVISRCFCVRWTVPAVTLVATWSFSSHNHHITLLCAKPPRAALTPIPAASDDTHAPRNTCHHPHPWALVLPLPCPVPACNDIIATQFSDHQHPSSPIVIHAPAARPLPAPVPRRAPHLHRPLLHIAPVTHVQSSLNVEVIVAVIRYSAATAHT